MSQTEIEGEESVGIDITSGITSGETTPNSPVRRAQRRLMMHQNSLQTDETADVIFYINIYIYIYLAHNFHSPET